MLRQSNSSAKKEQQKKVMSTDLIEINISDRPDREFKVAIIRINSEHEKA